jgi:DHA1 family tetracycline resistance protein-like MFS transporter
MRRALDTVYKLCGALAAAAMLLIAALILVQVFLRLFGGQIKSADDISGWALVATIILGLAPTLGILFLGRALAGVFSGTVSVANAYVADISAPQDRAKRFGLLGAMMGLGFIVGPVMGGLLGAIDLHLPFYVAGGLTLLNGLYGYFVLPESLPASQRKAFSWRSANPVSSLRKLGQLKGVGPLVGVVAFSALAQFVLYTVWVLYNSFKFGWGPSENGWSLAVVGIVAMETG